MPHRSAPELISVAPMWEIKRRVADNQSQESDVGITLKHNKKSSVICLEGAIDIAAAAEFKKLLLQAFGSGKEVSVTLDGATDLDVTAVQLIWVARRSAEGAGVAFTISGAVPEPVSSALGNAGLQEFLFPSDGELIKRGG